MANAPSPINPMAINNTLLNPNKLGRARRRSGTSACG